MRNPFPACAAVVLLTAALASCGSSAGGNGPAAAPSSKAPAARPSSGPPAPAGPSALPTVPADAITPATGTFTEEQKRYLENRVPRGMDPAAVLQSGQETCDKLRYLVKADRDTAVGAIVTNEIPDAADAVAGLCPRHRDLVDEAALGYADGTHTGKKLRPGVYRSASPTANCSWRIAGAGKRELASGTSDTGASRRITIPPGTRTFTSTGCYAWLPEGAAR
ncbi:hypothetical protein ACIP6P_04725 [Streptomyces sp. NPDC088729]|uniref:hypothetical protein n=1 Tax=Streptomyces sp. NPDC088729 TaxID=3365876 RepID=UPI00380D7DF4